MGPRKRAKPNPAETTSSASLATNVPPTVHRNSSTNVASSAGSTSTAGQETPISSQPDDPTDTTSITRPKSKVPKQQVTAGLSFVEDNTRPARGLTDRKVRKTGSWYGSWPRKSAASTSLARESILGGTSRPSATADFSRFDTSKKSSDATSVDNMSISSKQLPQIPENGNNTQAKDPKSSESPRQGATQAAEANGKVDQEGDAHMNTDKDIVPLAPAPEIKELVQRPATSSGWLGWFGRSEVDPKPAAPAETTAAESPKEVYKQLADQEPPKAPPEAPTEAPPEAPLEASKVPVEERPATSSGGFWFGLWQTPAAQPEQSASVEPPPGALEPPKDSGDGDVVMQDAPPIVETAPEPAAEPVPTPKAGSTWAFWSRDSSNTAEKGKAPAVQEEPGELAVIGESSESHPKRTNSIEIKETPLKEPPSKAASKAATPSTVPAKEVVSKKNKRNRPHSMDIREPITPRPITPKTETTPKPVSPAKTTGSKTPTSIKAPLPPNLLLPSFRSTYRMKENPSILSQIAQFLTRTQQAPANHVFLSKEQPKIKKAIAIGVHGLFPAHYIRAMVGQPTGTSIKFANHCAESIRRWANRNGCEDCEIEKVALEGEGKIGERVENLWKLLLNWIEHIRQADVILLACHSQGVPVTIMLLAKLIELQIITSARIGVCAMAGVSLGPFPDYRSSMGILMGSAAELWEFANPESEVSKRLEASLKIVLDYGARITYVGSIDDQLIPMESAIYSPAHHPYIYRSVFIDGRIHAPDFIAHLVGFALKLRNLGISDHGLVRELSLPLAGSLVGGEGHSRLYDDDQVYDLAVSHALETTSVGRVPCEIHKYEGLTQSNPYHLPWIMRGLLEEDFVKTELYSETAELLREFDDWKPVNKALKDVKYRLEAVRSKL
ncbi:hypothetical protein GQ53DRAFT_755078 [Thozetella sp. PMI_491]|nr:hypothetical protein GQ53DRAFT_755078 [Thozetella sp. PMI_491]